MYAPCCGAKMLNVYFPTFLLSYYSAFSFPKVIENVRSLLSAMLLPTFRCCLFVFATCGAQDQGGGADIDDGAVVDAESVIGAE